MAHPTTNGNGAVSSATKHRFPEIVLDTTLADLLAEGSDGAITESLCNIKPCADPRHRTVPVNTKYLITSTKTDDENDLAHLQLENVSYLLSFWAGHMEVPLVACEGSTTDDTLTKDQIDTNAIRGFAALNEKQRPWPRTFSNKTEFIQYYGTSKNRVRWGFAVDFAEQVPSYIHPAVHYRLNSKRWLAECSLRSANDRLIDPEGDCTMHRTRAGLWYFGPDCNDCRRSVEKELSRLKDRLQGTEPPFVLKITQSLGSVGTMLVQNEEDRKKTIEQIVQVQQAALPSLTADNAHIYPASLVLSDFLPGKTNALNFFVRRDGSIRFLGGCHQLSTRNSKGGRQSSALTWTEQEKLEQKFKDSLAEIGKVLHNEGYFGPCGADIIETEDGVQYVIDLNVRSTTSTVLGCLKGHCEKRNFDVCLVYECVLLDCSRETLETEFEKEFAEGRFILLGNTRLGSKDKWAYPIVLAGEDQDTVTALGARILKHDATGSSGAQDVGGA